MMNLVTRLRQCWQPVRLYLRFIMPARFAMITLGIVAFAFIANGQGQDILRALAEADADGSVHWPRTLLFVAAVALLASVVWFSTLHLLTSQRNDFPRTAKLLPRFLGLIAFVITIIALLDARQAYDATYAHPRRVLTIIASILALSAVVFMLTARIRRGAADKMTVHILLSLVALNVVFLLAATFAPLQLGHLGSGTIVYLAAALWVAVGWLIVWIADRVRFPVITVLLLLAMIFSCFNDNHAIRKLDATPGARPDLATYFHARYDRLRQISPNPGRLPVFVVATEGGGIRAAYWTTTVLTHLQDSIRNNGGPTFADHCFAISGVSGGSLGAIVFDALRSEEIDRGGNGFKLHPRAQAMLGEKSDALTPTLAVMLQPDLVQRFLPFRLFRDRAQALERSWEFWWRQAVGDDRFTTGFANMSEHYGTQLPLLLINGTMVEAGNRIITTGVRSDSAFGDSVDAFDHLGHDLRLSTSALMSARFTYVSPAGTLIHGCNVEGHVVDGGYFENSGAATGEEIAAWLQENLPVDVWVIIIKYGPDSSGFPPPERFANELLSPIRAIFDTRGARGELAVVDIRKFAPQRVLTFRLMPQGAPLPLGWLLSLRSQHEIDAAIESNENVAAAETIRGLIAPSQPIQPDAVSDDALKEERSQHAAEQQQ